MIKSQNVSYYEENKMSLVIQAFKTKPKSNNFEIAKEINLTKNTI